MAYPRMLPESLQFHEKYKVMISAKKSRAVSDPAPFLDVYVLILYVMRDPIG